MYRIKATAWLPGHPETKKSATLKIYEELKGYWLDEEGNLLTQADGVNPTIYFGQKVKIKVVATTIPDDQEIDIEIKAKSGDDQIPLDDGRQPIKLTLKIKGGAAISGPIFLDPLWYNEEIEAYDYTSHKTKIDPSKALTFYFDAKPKEEEYITKNLPKQDVQKLRPVIYRRNYEELVGLFKTDDSGDKDKEQNYENKYIAGNPEIKTIVDEFIKSITRKASPDIEKLVENKAKQLWDAAVRQKFLQKGNLDDRPLYWARNKMQVWLKRHPLYKGDYNEESIVTPGSGLAKKIKRFEELSRNYKGVDFSKKFTINDPNDPAVEKLNNLPKVLITGFDPFFLNEFDHPWKSIFNIRQSNPSGCVALALADTFELGANIQTMIFPVRYTDFDGSTAHDNGQGIGVVEEYIQPWIEKVDMVITISQAGEGDYNIDVFATATRGGTFDNMDFTRAEGSKSVSNIAPETIVTTLNKKFTEHPSQARYYGRYFETKSDYDNDINEQNSVITNFPKHKIYYGSGGNYLSNEIFYRVARLRETLKPNLQSGHFHISKLQDFKVKEDFNEKKMKKSLEKIEEAIRNGLKAL